MLQLDSLVTDLMFESGALPEQETLIEALGGEEVVPTLKILDPDTQDPTFEMQLSPSRPFRRRDQRRLMIISDENAPMRENPETDPVVPVDLRPAKDHLIKMCEMLPIRLGRLFSLGSPGDAVVVVRSVVDLRALALIPWVLDPVTDLQGRRRASPLTQQEFEEKLMAYDKRLEELSEDEILKLLGDASMERRGDLIIVDNLEDDGTWDIRKSLDTDTRVAAIERFSLLPGAPAGPAPGDDGAPTKDTGAAAAESAPAPAEPETTPPEAAPEPTGPALQLLSEEKRVIFWIPPERFDLETASQVGKENWTSVWRSNEIEGSVRDSVLRNGAGFVTSLEFLSEVFIDGKPLSKPQFEANARTLSEGVRALDVHYPRLGPVLLLDIAGTGRFISSESGTADVVVKLVPSIRMDA